ncbi:clotting factor G beta subunit-like [Battus philenor]|uniref:clotting factor G beta subunit-like n=1 Tax=Battus philenor TaxID=42288 RepID=UPI0035D09593
MEPFVVNGEFAKIRTYPHCVFIFVDCDGKWICGSSVLNQRILITAAHCLYGCRKQPRIDAFAGHEDIRKVTVKRRVNSILIHEKYNNRYVRNDIGLILLKDDLPLGNKIKRVIITKQSSHGLYAVVAGWGLVNDQTKEGTDILKSAKQKVRSFSTCNKVGTLVPGMMCAGSLQVNQPRPSQGDSGSALITANYRQIGIVSFRYPTYPGLVVYSNISYYYNWIKDRSRLLYCGKKVNKK